MLDDLSRGRPGRVDPSVTLFNAAITDADALAEAVEQAKPQVICHLAAQIDVRVSVDAPAADAAVNVVGTVNVLEAARAVGARVLFASTGGAIYGGGASIPTTEDEQPASGGAVRHREVLRRAVPRPLQPPPRHRARGAAARQRLRPAAGPHR